MAERSISEVAFDLWVEEDGLLDRLSLAAPERHDAAAQCWRYAGTKLDHQRRKVVHTFSRGVGVQEWSFNPWEGDRPDFEPVLQGTIHTLRTKASEAWRSASDTLDAAVAGGHIVISARVGSPLNEPQSIPSSAWTFVEVDDWSACTGDGEGVGDLYDLRESPPVGAAKPKGGKLLKAAEDAIAVLYPNGVPDHLGNDEVRGAINSHLKNHDPKLQVSLDTAKRAAGRR